ncbi:cysteine-rich repeat secretory protein 55-like [Phalaenopsis equestris]|uniref:cysteine-rich repeat secretory protein 55-like n=1 Tax=Phalaenopsis equestris TaxID=78828 RepID=UPI0009E3B16F|nr:cysteine-rich repeat secretory protein 55-like [Phalaenopsis equestris]
MAFSDKLFLLSVLLLSVASISHGADLITKECGNTSATNEALQANINSIILDLVTKTTSTGFANSTYGSANDTVYGTAECRGDISGQDCSACIIAAGLEIRTSCTNTTESRIWYQQCSLRYSTTNFIGQMDTNLLGVWASTNKMADPQAFKKVLKELFIVLGLAASSGESRKFGWGEIESNVVNNNKTIIIYGMAQCTSDLQGPDCLKGLDAAYGVLQSSCGDLRGCYVMFKSYAIRYQDSPFLFLNAAAPTPAATTRNITYANT